MVLAGVSVFFSQFPHVVEMAFDVWTGCAGRAARGLCGGGGGGAGADPLARRGSPRHSRPAGGGAGGGFGGGGGVNPGVSLKARGGLPPGPPPRRRGLPPAARKAAAPLAGIRSASGIRRGASVRQRSLR